MMKRHFQTTEICGSPVQFFFENGHAFLCSTDLSIALGYTSGSGSPGEIDDKEKIVLSNRTYIRHDAVITFFSRATGERKKQRDRAAAEIANKFGPASQVATSSKSDIAARIISAAESLQDFFDECERNGFDCETLITAAGIHRVTFRKLEVKTVSGAALKCLT